MTEEEKKLEHPLYPELEADNYEAEVKAEAAEAKKRAKQLEKQAKWDRDMALWGDMASLAAKGAAMHGGAWKINKDEPAAAKGNERLRVLQKENAAQLAQYAKQEVAARDAARKERNARAVAKYNAEVEAYKREQAQANTLARLEEQKRHNKAMEVIQTEREDRLKKQGGSGGGGTADFLKVTMPDGTEKIFSKKELGDNWINNAYEVAVKMGMPRLMRKKSKGYGGYIEYEDTSLAGRKAAIEAWSAENESKKTAVKPGSKGAIYTNDKKTKGAIY